MMRDSAGQRQLLKEQHHILPQDTVVLRVPGVPSTEIGAKLVWITAQAVIVVLEVFAVLAHTTYTLRSLSPEDNQGWGDRRAVHPRASRTWLRGLRGTRAEALPAAS